MPIIVCIVRIIVSDVRILYSCIINVVFITTHPMNVTVCLTQSRTATFNCALDRGGYVIYVAGWCQVAYGGCLLIPLNSRPRHMTNSFINGDILTDTLTVTNVSMDDNKALYRCEPIAGVTSMTASITVLGEVVICLSCAYKLYFKTLSL